MLGRYYGLTVFLIAARCRMSREAEPELTQMIHDFQAGMPTDEERRLALHIMQDIYAGLSPDLPDVRRSAKRCIQILQIDLGIDPLS